MSALHQGRVLILAGSDSGGGAGIQADIKAVTMMGGFAATAITAITVQNTLGVHGVHPLPLDLIAAQARAVLEDIGTDAVKTGMLGSVDVVETVAALLDEADAPAVVDPVMVAKGGHPLLPDAAGEAVILIDLAPHLAVLAAEFSMPGPMLSGQLELFPARLVAAGGVVDASWPDDRLLVDARCRV